MRRIIERLVVAAIIAVVMLLTSCGCKPTDAFRKKELRCMRKCERQFTRAVAECPDLIDTVTVEVIVEKPVEMDSAGIDSLLSEFSETLEPDTIWEKDSFYVQTPTKAQKQKTIYKYRDKIVKQTLEDLALVEAELEQGGVKARAWIEDGKLKLEITGQTTQINMPIQAEPWFKKVDKNIKWALGIFLSIILLLIINKLLPSRNN